MWVLYALLSALFASLVAVFAKIGMEGVDSDLGTAIRTTVVLFLVWGIALFRGLVPGIQGLTRHNWLFLILSGVATGLSWLFYFKALQLGPVSRVAPIDKLSVALAVVLAAVFLKEPLTAKTIIGAGLIVAGTVVLAWR